MDEEWLFAASNLAPVREDAPPRLPSLQASGRPTFTVVWGFSLFVIFQLKAPS